MSAHTFVLRTEQTGDDSAGPSRHVSSAVTFTGDCCVAPAVFGSLSVRIGGVALLQDTGSHVRALARLWPRKRVGKNDIVMDSDTAVLFDLVCGSCVSVTPIPSSTACSSIRLELGRDASGDAPVSLGRTLAACLPGAVLLCGQVIVHSIARMASTALAHSIGGGSGVQGAPGAGKTTVLQRVASALPESAAVLHVDALQLCNGEEESLVYFQECFGSIRNPSVILIDDIDVAFSCGPVSAPLEVAVRDATRLIDESYMQQVADVLNGNKNQSIPESLSTSLDIIDVGALAEADMRELLCHEGISTLSAADLRGFTIGDVYRLLRSARGDIRAALWRIGPSIIRDVAVEVPRVSWDDIGGLEDVKSQLREASEWSVARRSDFEQLGIRPPQGILLYGPPGCSKTLMARALATESSLNFIAVKGPELFNKYVGESEKAVARVFRKAREASPCIVFFDEIDALAVRRSTGSSGGASVAERVLAQLLTEMDGMVSRDGVVCVAATNRPDLLDPALLRPGRLDRAVYVSPPDRVAREEIFRIHLRSTPVDETVDIHSLAERTERCTGAEIAAICREAALAALDEDIEADKVSMQHFERALLAVPPRLSPLSVAFFERFAKDWKSGIR